MVSHYSTARWTHSLVDVGEPQLCFCSFCCSLCLQANIRSEFDGSPCWFNICSLTPCATRNLIRRALRINGDCVSDVVFSALCTPCVLVQLVREVRVNEPASTHVSGRLTRTTKLLPGATGTDGGHSREEGRDDDGSHGGCVSDRAADAKVQWSSGLCDIADDPLGCLCSTVCFPCTLGRAMEAVNGTNCVLAACCFPPQLVFNVIREAVGVEGSFAGDCLHGVFPILMCLRLAQIRRHAHRSTDGRLLS
eukprot:TRINITY_DN44775_c0_g1_i1.p1 TRINITY_DN44775_c0_g1~~TRINITY_DN44775_c0_g1_i1.p1  ORF type:complete len:250 (+),score=2.71 TRINITY_DN44775_c0_g1_i1:185-934(+)